MNAPATVSNRGLRNFTQAQTALIWKTAAKDCNATEFDEFLHVCDRTNLDPLRRQIYALVYNKDNAAKRNMSIIIGIDGYRAIAERTGTYRPNDKPTEFVYDEGLRGPANPLGIVSATVTVHKFSHGQWFPVVATAYWDEYAPVATEEWGDDPQTGKRKKFKLDVPKLDDSGKWAKMPRQMIEKCATAKAIRSGWPDFFSGLYDEAELDQARVLDLSPAEWAEQHAREDRMAKIGGKGTIMFDFPDSEEGLAPVPVGQLADRIFAFLKEHPDQAGYLKDRNTHPLREFWAMSPNDALAVKQEMERLEKIEGNAG